MFNGIRKVSNVPVAALVAGKPKLGPRAVLRRVKKELQMHSDQFLLDACQGNFDNITFEIVVKFALEGDSVCRQAIEDVAAYLGAGIADLVNVFNPELVVIGGAFILGKDILQPIIEKTIFSNALQPSTDSLRLAFSERGADACAFGAVAIVLDDILPRNDNYLSLGCSESLPRLNKSFSKEARCRNNQNDRV